MAVEEKMKEHLESFTYQEILETCSILCLSLNGQVIAQVGKEIAKSDVHTLGALLVGVWQASNSLKGFMVTDQEELKLSFQSSSSGYYIINPGNKNPSVFFAVLFENQVNPGKVKHYAQKLRDHLDQITLIEKNTEDEKLFKDITEEEVDKLFSFVGV